MAEVDDPLDLPRPEAPDADVLEAARRQAAGLLRAIAARLDAVPRAEVAELLLGITGTLTELETRAAGLRA